MKKETKAEREHIERLRKIATNKKFNAEKYARYFDDDGVIIPELRQEYLRAVFEEAIVGA